MYNKLQIQISLLNIGLTQLEFENGFMFKYPDDCQLSRQEDEYSTYCPQPHTVYFDCIY